MQDTHFKLGKFRFCNVSIFRGFRAKYIEELNRCLDMDGAAGSGGDPSDPRHDGDPSRINEEDGDEAAGDAVGDHCDHGSNSTDEGTTS